LPSMDDVQPIRSWEELRADVGRRARVVRRRDQMRIAVPALAAVLLAALGIGAVVKNDGNNDSRVRTIPPAERTGTHPSSSEHRPAETRVAPDPSATPASPSDVVGGGNAPSLAGPTRPTAEGAIVFVSGRTGNPDLFAVRPDGTGLRQLTFTGEAEGRPAVSPDGRLVIFYRSGRDSGLFIIRADGTDERKAPLPAGAVYPVWSPDGTRLAYIYNGVVWTSRVDGTDARPVTHDPGTARGWPSWSPDGREIAYTLMVEQTRMAVYAVNLASGEERLLLDDASQSSWSPDGQRLAVRKMAGSFSQIHVIARDGSGLRRVTHSDAWESVPQWSPDGRRLLFDRDSDGHDDFITCDGPMAPAPLEPNCTPGSNGPAQANLWFVGVDGSGERQLNSGNVDGYEASWSAT
jgi:hypothetical protein